jgi:hypothetical protein
MDPVTPQPEQAPVQPPKHFLNKKFVVTFIILLLLGGSTYARIQYWQNQQVAQEVVPTFTPRTDVTAGWKTYTNTQYGFEFKYPADATTREEKFTSCKNAAKECLRTFLTLSNGQVIEYQFSTFQGGRDFINAGDIKKEKIIIDNKEYEFWSDNQFVNIFSLSASNLVVSSYNDSGKIDTNILKEILSTFKFTDSSVQSGIGGTLTGHVTVGPNCPVEQAGNPCTPSPQAYTSRQVGVFTVATATTPEGNDNSKLITSQHLDANGNYQFVIAPGTYTIKASGMRVDLLTTIVGTVTVKNSQKSTLNFNIDTGIR